LDPMSPSSRQGRPQSMEGPEDTSAIACTKTATVLSPMTSRENRPSLREVGRLEALGEAGVDAPESLDE
jgi:hypothetical protein